MRIGVWNTYAVLNAAMLTEREAPIGDELLLPYIRFREAAERKGHSVRVITHPTTDFDAVIFFDMPNLADPFIITALYEIPQKYLVLWEPPTVKPQQWPRESNPRFLHQIKKTFTRILTWDDKLVFGDLGSFVKLNYAVEFPPDEEYPTVHEAPRFMACVASNKDSPHRLSLYGERRKTIEWYITHAPGMLDLYGPGWENNPAWCGIVPKKRETLRGYRFALCYENAKGLYGYVTEKILDCLIAGCVPVYWGAENVAEHIPEECFVDRRRFETHEALHAHLAAMSDAEWLGMRAAGRAFMRSALSAPFTTEAFADTLLTAVVHPSR